MHTPTPTPALGECLSGGGRQECLIQEANLHCPQGPSLDHTGGAEKLTFSRAAGRPRLPVPRACRHGGLWGRGRPGRSTCCSRDLSTLGLLLSLAASAADHGSSCACCQKGRVVNEASIDLPSPAHCPRLPAQQLTGCSSCPPVRAQLVPLLPWFLSLLSFSLGSRVP